MFIGKGGERLSIEHDVLFLESSNELAVTHAVFSESGIDADVPEPSEFAFLVAAMGEGICSSMEYCFGCRTFFSRTSKAISFYFSKDISAGLQGINSFFYSGH